MVSKIRVTNKQSDQRFPLKQTLHTIVNTFFSTLNPLPFGPTQPPPAPREPPPLPRAESELLSLIIALVPFF